MLRNLCPPPVGQSEFETLPAMVPCDRRLLPSSDGTIEARQERMARPPYDIARQEHLSDMLDEHLDACARFP